MAFIATLGLGLALLQPAGARTAPSPMMLIDPASVQPAQLLPAPPPGKSPAEAQELAQLRAIIASASAARLAQARADDQIEDPTIFDAAVGQRLTALPATWALLLTVQHETAKTIGVAKKYFARSRPWGIDPSLPNCDAGKNKKPVTSYPSGHAGLGFSVGFTLAQLAPEKAPAVLARAADYALSREICGVHFPSDIEASHVIGTWVATRLLADPRLATRIAAARAELAAARAGQPLSLRGAVSRMRTRP